MRAKLSSLLIIKLKDVTGCTCSPWSVNIFGSVDLTPSVFFTSTC